MSTFRPQPSFGTASSKHRSRTAGYTVAWSQSSGDSNGWYNDVEADAENCLLDRGQISKYAAFGSLSSLLVLQSPRNLYILGFQSIRRFESIFISSFRKCSSLTHIHVSHYCLIIQNNLQERISLLSGLQIWRW